MCFISRSPVPVFLPQGKGETPMTFDSDKVLNDPAFKAQLAEQRSAREKFYRDIQSQLPLQEPLAGSRAKMSPENQAFLDARVLEVREQMAERFDDAYHAMSVAMAGVAQASDHLRTAIDAVASSMDRNDCEGAAALGYADVSSAYIFLQRTLGDLQSTGHVRSNLIVEIAGQVAYSFEEVVSLLPEKDHVTPIKPAAV